SARVDGLIRFDRLRILPAPTGRLQTICGRNIPSDIIPPIARATAAGGRSEWKPACKAHQYERDQVTGQSKRTTVALLLREKHVTELLDMKTAIEAVEEVLRDQAEGLATNRPRYRVAAPTSQLHVMAAGDRRLGVYGLKAYTASKKGARF